MMKKKIDLGTGDVTTEEVKLTDTKFKNKYPDIKKQKAVKK